MASNNARDLIRSAMFSIKPRSTIVELASGVKVEVRQPTIGDLVEDPDRVNGRREASARMIIRYCFVPGTEEKVFDDADIESLLAVPFGNEWVKLQKAIEGLIDLDTVVAEQAKN